MNAKELGELSQGQQPPTFTGVEQHRSDERNRCGSAFAESVLDSQIVAASGAEASASHAPNAATRMGDTEGRCRLLVALARKMEPASV